MLEIITRSISASFLGISLALQIPHKSGLRLSIFRAYHGHMVSQILCKHNKYFCRTLSHLTSSSNGCIMEPMPEMDHFRGSRLDRDNSGSHIWVQDSRHFGHQEASTILTCWSYGILPLFLGSGCSNKVCLNDDPYSKFSKWDCIPCDTVETYFCGHELWGKILCGGWPFA